MDSNIEHENATQKQLTREARDGGEWGVSSDYVMPVRRLPFNTTRLTIEHYSGIC